MGGENLYPPRDDPRDSGIRRTSTSGQTSGYTSGYSSGPSRKYSYQSDKYSDRSSPEVAIPNRRVHNNQEDDDLDAMINDLKQKTSGRDMHKMVQDIEGENHGQNIEQNRSYGRKSVSPVPR